MYERECQCKNPDPTRDGQCANCGKPLQDVTPIEDDDDDDDQGAREPVLA